MKEINFDKLCFESMRTGNLRNLAMIAIEMNEWYMPCEEVDKEKIKPVIGCIRDESWIFAFTDLKRTENFLKRMKIDAKIIKTTARCAIYVLKECEKSGLVKGIRFNEGISGWYLDSQNLESIMDEIKSRKRKNEGKMIVEETRRKAGEITVQDTIRKAGKIAVEEIRRKAGCNAVNKGNVKDRTFRNY